MRVTTLLLTTAILCAHAFNTAIAQEAPASWEIKGDATIVYHCRIHAIPHKVVIPEANKRNLARFVRSLAQQQGETVTDEQVEQRVAAQVARSEAPADPTPHSYILTESVHNGAFLYKFAADPDDATNLDPGQETVIFDGTQTLSRLSGPANGGSRVTTANGLGGTLLNVFPAYCSQIASVSMMRNIAPTGPNTYKAEVIHAGGGDSQTTYLPAVVTSEAGSGGPRIAHITVSNTGGKYIEYELSDYQTTGSVTVPRHIREVRYDTANGDAPYQECDYTLKSATAASLEDSAFNTKGLLDSHSIVMASAHGKEVTVPGYRSDMSLKDQVEKAYIEQEAQKHSVAGVPARSPAGVYLLGAMVLVVCAAGVRYRMARR